MAKHIRAFNMINTKFYFNVIVNKGKRMTTLGKLVDFLAKELKIIYLYFLVYCSRE